MSCKEGTNHDHISTEADRLGNITVSTNSSISNNRFTAALAHQRRAANCQPPVPKPVLTLVIQTLPGPIPTLVASAPAFSSSRTAFWCSHISSNNKGIWQFFLDVLNHRNHAIRMTMSNINRDVLRASALSWLTKSYS